MDDHARNIAFKKTAVSACLVRKIDRLFCPFKEFVRQNSYTFIPDISYIFQQDSRIQNGILTNNNAPTPGRTPEFWSGGVLSLGQANITGENGIR